MGTSLQRFGRATRNIWRVAWGTLSTASTISWLLPGGVAVIVSAFVSSLLELQFPWNAIAFLGLTAVLGGLLLILFKALGQLFSSESTATHNYGIFVEQNYGTISLSPDPADPATTREYGDIIRGETVYLPDLVKDMSPPIIENKSFERCWINGPAWVIPMDHVSFHQCGFRGLTPTTIFRAFPDDELFNGVIAIRNTRFNQCTFNNIVFVEREPIIEAMRHAIVTGAITRI